MSHCVLFASAAVQSIDNSDESNATLKMDLLDVVPSKHLEFVPDFIWISLPCHTYSNLAAGKHRSVRDGELDRSKTAREHDYLFCKIAEMIRWVKAKHPHVILMFENPEGQLQHMPLMQNLTQELGLEMTTVDYCQFGRYEKKPTNLWTNNSNLKGRLAGRRCTRLTCYSYKKHPKNVRDGKSSEFSAIPWALAHEVAEYVDAKFVVDGLRCKPAASPRDDTVL